MDLIEFRRRFKEIKEMGWVPSQRRGPTGIGYTLEKLLGISENNIALPDLSDEMELKAHRINSPSMITLFTYNRDAWKMNPLEAIRKYGTVDKRKNRLGMYFTLSQTPNSSGIFLHIEDGSISVRHIDGSLIVEWDVEKLAEQFQNKIGKLIFVSALSEMRGKDEWFKFTSARLLSGTSPDVIKEQIQAGHILIDLRLHDKGTSARNHGTGFRTYEKYLPFIFETTEEI